MTNPRAQLIEELSLIQAARMLLDDPEHWTKHAYARGYTGRSTSPIDPSAVCWCSVGATRAFLVDNRTASNARACVQNQLTRELLYYNDLARTTHSGVLKKFDAAIEECALEIDGQAKPSTATQVRALFGGPP